jgi:hypothetical protein
MRVKMVSASLLGKFPNIQAKRRNEPGFFRALIDGLIYAPVS